VDRPPTSHQATTSNDTPVPSSSQPGGRSTGWIHRNCGYAAPVNPTATTAASHQGRCATPRWASPTNTAVASAQTSTDTTCPTVTRPVTPWLTASTPPSSREIPPRAGSARTPARQDTGAGRSTGTSAKSWAYARA
jgi:hypothetical protein